MESAHEDRAVMFGDGNFTAVRVNESGVRAALTSFLEAKTFEGFNNFLGFELRCFGHQAERNFLDERVTVAEVTKDSSESAEGTVSPSTNKDSR